MTELFTPEQVREHIIGLRRWVGQSKAKAEKNQAMEHSMSENSCQLCAGMEKKKNDEETEEWWVQCDKCEAWQHQICALFNGRRNDGGQAEYTCPNCYIIEFSVTVEDRLFTVLKKERLERAEREGKSYDEVPGAEGLVVRVVSSVDKKLEVKSRFLEVFQEENYPLEFPYKSKVLLLFQKIEGVEVLSLACVQEFGLRAQPTTHTSPCLSLRDLDSVKYFRPEIKAVSGEALRTFVYHEILIGYLEYCKKRGFTSCYIWACPPLKARLPYFDGDYWPGAAGYDLSTSTRRRWKENIIRRSHEEDHIKKSFLKVCQSDLSGNATKDILLMHKLGETISPMKEDFIMVHLQHACTHCCILMVSGKRWYANNARIFSFATSAMKLSKNRLRKTSYISQRHSYALSN
ncbi:hypothetical protein HAX54_004457 [Datura stramonium]|uniref:histone acetyltransferase n=1 Tax=Datura stramonium TaxID=4076 RepID=A0ABS8T702_DATST|nr:hypothetical protein [Datura stramonium]